MNKNRDFNVTESGYKDRLKQRYRPFFGPVCLLILGLFVISLGLFLKTPFVGSVIHVCDPRLLPWEIIFLFPVISILPLQIRRDVREWCEYDDTEKRDVRKRLLFWGAFVAAILLFSVCVRIGRLSHFPHSSPVLSFPQIFSFTAFWRTSWSVELPEPTVLSNEDGLRE